MQLTATTSTKKNSREWHNEGVRLLTDYAQYRLLGALQAKGLFAEAGEQVSVEVLKNQLSLQEKYDRLFNGVLEILERCEWIKIEEGVVETLNKALASETQEWIAYYQEHSKLTEDEAVHEFCSSYVKMIQSTAAQFTAVLSGEKSYVEALFPNGSHELAAGIYNGSVKNYINNKVADIIKAEVQRLHAEDSRRVINILEVGAGTGMSTDWVLEKIADYRNAVKFWYTDLGRSFVRRAKRKYSADHPMMEFKALDIDQCPIAQGFEAESMDIIVCNDVVHATPSITNTLKNIYTLSSMGGYVVINDVSRRYDFNTITFGLADGWWLYQDPELRIPHSPLLSNRMMEQLLQGLGYRDTNIQGLDALRTEEHGQSITTGYKRT